MKDFIIDESEFLQGHLLMTAPLSLAERVQQYNYKHPNAKITI